MAIHTEALDLIHDLNSVILSRRLVVAQAKPKNLLANSGEEVVVVIQSTLGVEVLVGCTVCHVVKESTVVRMLVVTCGRKAVSDPAAAKVRERGDICPSCQLSFPLLC